MTNISTRLSSHIRMKTHLTEKNLSVINATFRLKYVPKTWIAAEVTIIPKPQNPPNKISS